MCGAETTSVGCCSRLNFEPSGDVSWQSENSDRPSVNEMIAFIDRSLGEMSSQDAPFHQANKKEYVATFLYKTCEQEDVGIKNIDEIRKIVTEIDRQEFITTQDQPNYVVETSNLYRAYKMLQSVRSSAVKENEDDKITPGLLEIDACVVDVHRCLMNGLPMKTPAGQFSTDVRKTMACGEIHEYPKFETHSDAVDAVMMVIDRYNDLYFLLKNRELKDNDRIGFLKNFFKCAAWLFYNLVSLHPFGDGNGRLCRLILNFVLESVFPFPIPLSDVLRPNSRDVYINAVVSPRKSDGFPSDLAALIVESTYRCCKRFTDELEVSKTVSVVSFNRSLVFKSFHDCSYHLLANFGIDLTRINWNEVENQLNIRAVDVKKILDCCKILCSIQCNDKYIFTKIFENVAWVLFAARYWHDGYILVCEAISNVFKRLSYFVSSVFCSKTLCNSIVLRRNCITSDFSKVTDVVSRLNYELSTFVF